MLTRNGAKAKLRRTAWLVALLWTGLVLALAAWHYDRFLDQNYELARVHARAAHTKDLIYRQWNAHHGGVYVPITDSLKPNPFLHVPHRDVETLSGQKLTLINPAYMTRQVHEIGASNHEITAHITSLKPLNPANAPDDWERSGLELFEQGEIEVASIKEMGDQRVGRLMRPLIVKESCLKCHEQQGYVEGDIRGGISVVVPVEPIIAARESEVVSACFAYCALWTLGMLGLAMAWRALSRSIGSLEGTISRLNKQRRIAEKAVRVRSIFLANMNYKIRTPLTAILGHADVLAEGHCCGDESSECSICAVHGQTRTSIETIRKNGRDLLEIVREVLDLSKIESGEFQLTSEACCLEDLITEIAALMDVRAASKGLELVVQCEESAPQQMVVDAGRLRQILLNLMDNAIKYTEVGCVTVGTRTDLQDGRECLAIDVKDTGPGIAKERINAIFEPFIGAKTSSKQQDDGAGLGLAISHRLATALGGRLTANSTPGQGSCFTLTLPVPLPANPQFGMTDSGGSQTDCSLVAEDLDSFPSLELAGRVLVVEDSAVDQQLITHILRNVGIEPVLAENGKIACELVWQSHEQEPYDLILMDVRMPVMNGYAATRALRRSGYQGTIVALTAHATSEESEMCLRCGYDEFATKPIERPALLTILARYLTAKEETEMVAASGVS